MEESEENRCLRARISISIFRSLHLCTEKVFTEKAGDSCQGPLTRKIDREENLIKRDAFRLRNAHYTCALAG